MTHIYTHPEVQRLARLLLESRQDRGVAIKAWHETSDAQRTALLRDAAFVLRNRGLIMVDDKKVA